MGYKQKMKVSHNKILSGKQLYGVVIAAITMHAVTL
jgi:hypothetical protein